MKILVVEDEVKTASYLKKGLEEHGLITDLADNGIDALFQVETQEYDLVILDVMLPEVNGWEVIKHIRQKNIDVPILFLTARDALSDKVKGLRLGADDYMVKPFHFVELVARIFSIIRRGNKENTNTLSVGDLIVDLNALRASRGGQKLDLTAKEFSLLSFLVRNEGNIVSRTMISEQVWDMNFDSDTNIVDVAIKRLRNKVDSPFEKKLIHTVRGLGYVLERR
ncbi:heavy metal response regulator transcription factor [Cysteiniphilum halobium]|uniref:heavy metal response regulator transcription factor n=1 Tax=Cysteiniphilum halobium TaxID=2219059 RepID=UPI000E655B9C|nr:heavy metal response regulator transcription factor [Cysteiniphilum halobium]